MRAAASLVLLAACYGGGYDVLPQITGDECYSFDCPLMAGGEVRAHAVVESDTGAEVIGAHRASISPAGLAEVTLDGEALVIRAGAEPGLGVVHVDLAGGDAIDRDFSVVAGASVAVAPDDEVVPLELFPEGRLPGGRLAMFGGDSLEVNAEFRDANGQRLLGHDDSPWEATNLQLAQLEPADTQADTRYDATDTALVRRVLANDVGTATVAFGSAMLAIDVVPPRTTARIEVRRRYDGGTYESLSLARQEYRPLTVMAYAADGRYIYGATAFIPLAVMSSDPDVVGVDIVDGSARTFGVHGYRSGTATLAISFDNQVIALPVTVE